jgi:hypothetical protein
MGAVRSSPPPSLLDELVGSAWATPRETRAKALSRDVVHRDLKPENLPLRAGGVGRTTKLKSPLRAHAREKGAEDLAAAVAASGIPLEDLAKAFGLHSDREGAEIASGKVLATFGEIIALAPIDVLKRAFARGFERRIANDNALGFDVGDLRLIVAMLESLK